MNRFARAAMRAVNYGVGGQPPPEVRWIQTVNLVAMVSFLFNALFTIFYGILNIRALGSVMAANVVWGGLYCLVLLANRSGRHLVAAWLLLATGWVNLTIAAIALGVDSGIYLFLLLIPVLGLLFSPPGDWVMPVVVVVGGLLVFVSVPMLFPDGPAFLSGTTAEDVMFITAALGTGIMAATGIIYYRSLAEIAEARSERLLLNILPPNIAVRLKAGESPIADRSPDVTVLFGDIVGSTAMAERLAPDDLVGALDRLFSAFDDICDELGLEKIKTIGDGYFAVAGLSEDSTDHPVAAAEAALRMRSEVTAHSVAGFGQVRMRFGLHVGPVIAGVIGKRKFSYDLWGDTVNVGSRMESTGEPGMIQVSPQMYERLKHLYEFLPQGTVDIKGKGPLSTFMLIGKSQ